MPWNLDDLEDDDEFAEVDAGMQQHLRDMASPDEIPQESDQAEEDTQAPYAFPEPAAGKNPTIFLNIEGVLFPQGGCTCGQSQLSQLKRIVDATKAQIVLSCDDRSNEMVKRVAAALASADVLGLIGQTPDLKGSNPDASVEELRVGEISWWLDDHDSITDEDRWVVLDDCALDTETEDGVHHTVQTDGSTGLTEADADAAIKILAAAA